MNRSMLVKAVFRENHLFTAALLLIYTLTMALMVMVCFFSESIDATFQTFLEDYGLPDAYIVTDGTPASLESELCDRPGVETVSAGLALDLQTELPSGKILSLRYISAENGEGIGLYNTETCKRVQIREDTVAISSAFARNNGLVPGDVLTLSDGEKLVITDIVSSPETISMARNAASWYDEQDFAYIYLPTTRLELLTGLSGIANQFRIYYDADADGETVLQELLSTDGLNAISSEQFEGSAVDRQIRAGIDGTKSLVTYLPGFIALISILFSTIFMRQILYAGKNKIALLRTFGYTPADISAVYICYSLFLTVLSSLLGGALGAVLLRTMLNIYRSVFDLPVLRISGRIWMLGIVFLALQLIGILSCLLCTSEIYRADPATAFRGGDPTDNEMLPAWLNRRRRDSFSKIAAASMVRSRRRLVLSALCCMACLCLNYLVFALLISRNVGLESLFRDRLCYDAMVYCGGEQAGEAINAVSALSGVTASERHISFSTTYDGEVMRIETLETADALTKVMDTNGNAIVPSEAGILVEEGFARRHSIREGDIITVDGVSLQVTGLTREYLYPVMYISPEQAVAFGYEEYNSLAVSFSENYTIIDFSRDAVDIPGYQYFTDISARNKCATQTLSQLDLPCLLFLVFALVIGVVIISNMNLISIRERSREYATLHVLGTEERRFAKMIATESAAQYILSCLPGIPAAIVISSFLMQSISSVSQEYPPERMGLAALLACGTVLLYNVFGALITFGYIRRMNVVKILATKE